MLLTDVALQLNASRFYCVGEVDNGLRKLFTHGLSVTSLEARR